MQNTPKFDKIEAALRQGGLTVKKDDEFACMAQLVLDESPSNPTEFFKLLSSRFTNGASFNKPMKKLCGAIMKDLKQKDLIGVAKPKPKEEEQATPSTVQESDDSDKNTPKHANEKSDEEYKMDPAWMNTTTMHDQDSKYVERKRLQAIKIAADKQARVEASIDEFIATKEAVPPPTVMHDKSELYNSDLFIPKVTIIAGHQVLIEEATLKFTRGRKYGLIGRNGTGKTTLINAICRKELDKMPQNLHILQVEQEVPGDDMNILDHVLACDTERLALMKEQDDLTNEDTSGLDEEIKMEKEDRLAEVIERLDLIDATEAPSKAAVILNGLGFSEEQLCWPSSKFSGGWRMRISIAKVVFCEPEILMLDEPTNHLDLVALIWLEQYVMALDVTVVIVSHAKDFLNNVVDEIIELSNKKLEYYRGNFDTFEKVKATQITQRIKRREFQLEEIAHNQKFVDQFRANAKRATLVQSRMKVIHKIREDMEDEIFQEVNYVFRFPEPPRLNRPLLRITDGVLGYSKDVPILKNVSLDIDMDTRIAFVGPNGAGKSTLIKTFTGKIDILEGHRSINGKLTIGLFDQHHFEGLNPRISALETFRLKYPEVKAEPLMRHLGSFGIGNDLATKPMQLLSGGQKSRVAFSLITYEEPQILLLDEPTNHLDYDAINALIESLKGFKGGLVIISHDQYFLNSLCNQIAIVDNGRISPYKGNINDYIKDLRKKYAK